MLNEFVDRLLLLIVIILIIILQGALIDQRAVAAGKKSLLSPQLCKYDELLVAVKVG